MKFPKKLYVTRHEDGTYVYFSSHTDVDGAHDALEKHRGIAVYKLDSTGKSKRKTKFIKKS